jgi:D-tyrosyl-tRNA(Tyr) deacylase
MKIVMQRVAKASVTVSDEVISTIQHGLCVLVGICRDDTQKDVDFIVRKILTIRLFESGEEESGAGNTKWNKSVVDRDMEVLCVSQFTLQSTLKGTKPDFHLAMNSEQSKDFYEKFLDALRKAYKPEKIKDGRFGAYMQVNIQNDGPVTILVDSKKETAAADSNTKSSQVD